MADEAACGSLLGESLLELAAVWGADGEVLIDIWGIFLNLQIQMTSINHKPLHCTCQLNGDLILQTETLICKFWDSNARCCRR